MKFLIVIAIVCNYATEVRPIVCLKGSGSTCQSSDVICAPSDTSCQTISITRATGESIDMFIEQGCARTTQAVSFTSGHVFGWKGVKSCSVDSCNTQSAPDSANRTQNGLECFGCYANTSDSCTSHQTPVKCVGQEDRCFYGSGTQSLASIGPTFFARGCVTQNVCDGSTNLNDLLINLNAQPKCCKNNLCNVGSEPLNVQLTTAATDNPSTDAKSTSVTPAATQTTSPPVTDTTSPAAANTTSPAAANATSPAAANPKTPAAANTTSPAAANATSPAAANTTSTAASKCASTPVAILCLVFLFAHKEK
ncbi:phospholipase A2 inhibitor and Ly6/PLAUR domain-containing protein-like isoform X2 [Scyliorhinus torazame]|uniref:phospholipase A2 inhibitor and Ly6/PLAUR domain-containing protein-like isoform X2 n=1 Tax=Scyliorhinus torazame TaxID=75743 RepID=UPI003B5B2C99